MSWDPNTAVITHPDSIDLAVWSQCSNFIAIFRDYTWRVYILDSVTHQQLQTLELPGGVSTRRVTFAFSPDSRILTCYRGGCDNCDDPSVISWDLQTGGIVSVIKWQGLGTWTPYHPSIVYSADGKLVGVCYWYGNSSVIFIHDVISGLHIHSHLLDSPVWNGKPSLSNGSSSDDSSVPDDRWTYGRPASDISLVSNNGQACKVSSTGKVLRNIWTHGDSLRFATLGLTTITIWEVGFASGTTPTEVETLFVPENVCSTMPHHSDYGGLTEDVEFLPTLSRLAVISQSKVLVWDARNSKSLLSHTDTRHYQRISFSSDGRFFACSTNAYEIHLWKESPTGYVLYGTPMSSTPRLLLSPNGESIVTFDDRTIRLWDTKSFTTPPSSISTQTLQHTGDFILDFSPDRTLAAVARKEDSVVTVLDLKSGAPRLSIDASMGIYGLRVIEDSVVVVGNGKVITWDLPAGDHIPNARVNVDDSTRAITLGSPIGAGAMLTASISSDLRHVAVVPDPNYPRYLYIYSTSAEESPEYCTTISGIAPWFTPDGCELWCVGITGTGEKMMTVTGSEHGPIELSEVPRVDIEHPPEGYPWESPHGYRATDDGWVLGQGGKRLLMLPPPWQSWSVLHRVWNGRFLALLHGTLPEPVIMELDL